MDSDRAEAELGLREEDGTGGCSRRARALVSFFGCSAGCCSALVLVYLAAKGDGLFIGGGEGREGVQVQGTGGL